MVSTDPTNSIDKPKAWDVPYAIHVDAPATTGVSKSPVPVASIATTVPPCLKNPHDAPAATPSEEQWEAGLFDCFGAPAHALSAFFFPFVNGAYTARWIGKSAILTGVFFFVTHLGSIVFACIPAEYTSDSDGSYTHDSSDREEFKEYHGASAACFVLFAVGVLVLRRQVRTFHRIRGSVLDDVCASFWCSCCVLAQMSVHTQQATRKRELMGTATLPAYSAA